MHPAGLRLARLVLKLSRPAAVRACAERSEGAGPGKQLVRYQRGPAPLQVGRRGVAAGPQVALPSGVLHLFLVSHALYVDGPNLRSALAASVPHLSLASHALWLTAQAPAFPGSQPGLVEAIVRWCIGVIASLGYVGVALLVALESTFVPIPSDILLPMAGFAAGQGRLSLIGVILAATVGSVFGGLVLYAIGRSIGERRLYRLLDRFGRYALLDRQDLEYANDWFTRHGDAAVLIGRLMPAIRSVISIPAGLIAMPLERFILYTAIGSGLWNGLLVVLGAVLGRHWRAVAHFANALGLLTLAITVAAFVWFVASRWRRVHG